MTCDHSNNSILTSFLIWICTRVGGLAPSQDLLSHHQTLMFLMKLSVTPATSYSLHWEIFGYGYPLSTPKTIHEFRINSTL